MKKSKGSNKQVSLKVPFGMKAASKVIPEKKFTSRDLELCSNEKNQLTILKHVFDAQVWKQLRIQYKNNQIKKRALRLIVQVKKKQKFEI